VQGTEIYKKFSYVFFSLLNRRLMDVKNEKLKEPSGKCLTGEFKIYEVFGPRPARKALPMESAIHQVCQDAGAVLRSYDGLLTYAICKDVNKSLNVDYRKEGMKLKNDAE
jgi:hypothetical protein